MSHLVLPALFALFVWWFSTGLIIYLDGLPPRTFKWSMAGATVLLVLGFFGLGCSASDGTVVGAYIAFASAMLIWAWHEISFYTGYVTGPRTHACHPGCKGWRHFGHAIGVSLYHELAIIASAALVIALTWHMPNHVGLWTFVTLWAMHESARVNVLLGVWNLSEHFLPDHMQFLRGFMTKKRMNLLFPISVTAATVVCTVLIERALAPGATRAVTAGSTFLATMMVIATLEHWFLVVPLPTHALWGWGMKSRPEGRIWSAIPAEHD